MGDDGIWLFPILHPSRFFPMPDVPHRGGSADRRQCLFAATALTLPSPGGRGDNGLDLADDRHRGRCPCPLRVRLRFENFGVRRFIAAFCPCRLGMQFLIGKFLKQNTSRLQRNEKAAMNRRTPKHANPT